MVTIGPRQLTGAGNRTAHRSDHIIDVSELTSLAPLLSGATLEDSYASLKGIGDTGSGQVLYLEEQHPITYLR